MKIFWPNRSKAKGFSIETLALKYRERIANVSSNKSLNQYTFANNKISINEAIKQKNSKTINGDLGHWANREFLEYKIIA